MLRFYQGHLETPKKHAQLFEIVDCGGLSATTQLCFGISTIAVQLYTSLASNDLVKKIFFTCPINVLPSQASDAVANGFHETLIKQQCPDGHFTF